MAHVERLRVYPVKALDGIEVEETTITPGGTLEGDREYALFDAAGEVINGKRTPRVHDFRTDFDPGTHTLTVRDAGGSEASSHPRRFDLDTEREAAAEWFGERLDLDVRLERDADLGFVDRREAGPSVISTATIEEVASWFEELTPHGVRKRLRANVEIGGVPAFWEDRFVGEGTPAFETGEVRFDGVEPCGRCVVPERDPDTGEPLEGFREHFIERRRETVPEWAEESAFDHYYALMLIAAVPETDRGADLRVREEVRVDDS